MIDKRLRGVWSRIQRTNGRANGSSGGIDERADEDAGRSTTEEDEQSSLFECPECGTVYVDAEKEMCQNCRTEVSEVRSTLVTE